MTDALPQVEPTLTRPSREFIPFMGDTTLWFPRPVVSTPRSLESWSERCAAINDVNGRAHRCALPARGHIVHAAALGAWEWLYWQSRYENEER